MTGGEAIRLAIAKLRDAGVPGPERDARWLFAEVAGVARDRVTLVLQNPIDEATSYLFFNAVEARASRKPMSHILGGRDFYGRWFTVTPDVLDPRPETEMLVAEALKAPFTRVMDLGTGSGCILVTLLAERPEAKGVGIDISGEAVLVAGENAARHGVADRIVLPMSEWWDDTGGRYDLIVSNPPYIAAVEMAGLAPELAHEPRIALTDEADGLSAYRAIIDGLPDHLTPGARVLFEVGPTQADAVRARLSDVGIVETFVVQDLDGRDRVVGGQWPG
ncbi:MAG: peptide chain release factor N(5)-glutamine methyltransferase [Pseudomonadota bacterium]